MVQLATQLGKHAEFLQVLFLVIFVVSSSQSAVAD
jgi:hypothetical protein